MKFDQQTYRLTDGGAVFSRALILGLLALALSAVGYFTDSAQFFYSYLTAYLFWVTAGIGALFFVMLFHLTGTVWGVVLRRIAEVMMQTLPYMALFFIPVIFGMSHLYHWTHPDAGDAVLQHKAAYLNIPFFIVRSAIYFTSWYVLARVLFKASVAMDENPSAAQVLRMRKISAGGMVIYAITVTFAAIDWVMSLEPHWYSTIFGAYIFAGSLISALSFFVIIGMGLRRHNILSDAITVEHYHDLAKMIFGFIIFWGYMGFSQYFLMWYANIPEETIYFFKRWQGNWKIITMILVLGHFALPFVLLLPRALKRNMHFLKILAYWVLIMHWFDVYWMVMVNHSPQGIQFSWMDVTLFVGMGAVILAVFRKVLGGQALVPVGDIHFQASLNYENPT